jgi:hypothetical protein
MDLEPEAQEPKVTENLEFAESNIEGIPIEKPTIKTPIEKPSLETQTIEITLEKRKPFEFLRDTESFLRRQTVSAIVPILPEELGNKIQTTSTIAEEYLNELAEIQFDEVTELELRPARIRVGLAFVGFGALMVSVLLLYLNTIHPELSALQQIGLYWYEYVWFVCFGVAGLFSLGREAMRPRPVKKRKRRKRKKALSNEEEMFT